jgi:type VI secretion system protein VasI
MKRSILLLLACILASSSALAADTSKSIAKCSAIPGDLERLQCFDNLSRNLGLDAPRAVPAKIAGIGKWNVKKTVNPIDDSTTVTLMLTAESGISKFGNPIFLVVRCQSNSTDLFISWQDYLGSDAYVTSRVGSSAADTRAWSLSTDSQATFYPENPVAFIKKLSDAEKFVAQVTPYSESPSTAIFDIRGLTEAIAPLRGTCKW